MTKTRKVEQHQALNQDAKANSAAANCYLPVAKCSFGSATKTLTATISAT